MPAFHLKMADIPFKVSCLFDSTEEFCKDYMTDDLPSFEVKITVSDIQQEREIAMRQDILDGIPVRSFSDEYLETIALYRKLTKPLLLYHCIVFHGAVVAVNGKGYLFTAKSGTGKTTHTKLWLKNIENSYILNGDKPLIKAENEHIIVYGTLWRGKEEYGINNKVPLKAICILSQSKDNCIKRITPADAFPLLYQQVYQCGDIMDMKKTVELLGAVAQGVDLFRMGCNMENEAAFMAYEAMCL